MNDELADAVVTSLGDVKHRLGFGLCEFSQACFLGNVPECLLHFGSLGGSFEVGKVEKLDRGFADIAPFKHHLGKRALLCV